MKVARSERKAWAHETFRGCENFLIPSFGADLHALDEEGIRLDVRQAIRHGVFSTQCALEAGLGRDEQVRMLRIAVEEADGRIAVSLPLCGESLAQNLELLREAERAGATHAAVGFPQYFSPISQDEVYAYVRELANSTGLGLCLVAADRHAFHSLHPSGVPLDAYERLSELDNVVALQLGSWDAGLVLECFERFSDRLLVTSLNFAMLPMLAQNFGLHWAGASVIEALQSPESPHAVRFVAELQEGRMEEAMTTYWKMAPALGATMRITAGIAPSGATHWPLHKYQQWLSGGNGGMTRQPCMRLFEREMQAVRGAMRAIGITCADDDARFYAGRSCEASA